MLKEIFELFLVLMKEYKNKLLPFFLIFACFIFPYNILLIYAPEIWTSAILFDKILLSIGLGISLTWLPALLVPDFISARSKKISEKQAFEAGLISICCFYAGVLLGSYIWFGFSFFL